MLNHKHNILTFELLTYQLIIQTSVVKTVNSLLSSSAVPVIFNCKWRTRKYIYLNVTYKHHQCAVKYIISAVFDLIVALIHFCALTHVGVPNTKILFPFFFVLHTRFCNLCQDTSNAYNLWTEANNEPPQTLNHNLHVFRISHSSHNFNIHTPWH